MRAVGLCRKVVQSKSASAVEEMYVCLFMPASPRRTRNLLLILLPANAYS